MKALLKSIFYSKFMFIYIVLMYIAIFFNAIVTHNIFLLLVFPFNVSLVFSTIFLNVTQKNLFEEFLISSPLSKNGVLNAKYLISLIFNTITIILLFITLFIRLNLTNTILIENVEISNYMILMPVFSSLLMVNAISIICSNISSKNIQSLVYFLLLFGTIYLFKLFILSNIFKDFNIKCLLLALFCALIYIFSYFISRLINYRR